MKEFKVSADKASLENRKRISFRIPIMVMALMIGIFSAISKSDFHGNLYTFLPPVILISIALIFGIRRGSKINKDVIDSYKIELLDNSIKKYQKNVPIVEINKSEITSIVEVKNKGITIRTENINKYIYIPVIIEEYLEIRKTLSELREIEIKENNYSQYINIIASLGSIIAVGIIMISENSYVVIPVGTVFLVILIWSIYKIQTNQHIDSRIKKNSWFILFPILFIFLKVFYCFFR